MKNIKYSFTVEGKNYMFEMIYVEGTTGDFYLFGADEKKQISIKDFFISKFPVTQSLWKHIIGNNANPSIVTSNDMVEKVMDKFLIG